MRLTKDSFLILTSSQMHEVDKYAIEHGTTGLNLMEKAGKIAFHEIRERYENAHKIAVISGPGNNGGDGFVVARLLRDSGCEVDLFIYGSADNYKGEALAELKKWNDKTNDLSKLESIVNYDIIVDAIFGTGLKRKLDDKLFEIIEIINHHSKHLKVVSLDMPTGICSDSGKILGDAIRADLTITFGRKKPGHLLLPGKNYTGEVILDNIGINDNNINLFSPYIQENNPIIWKDEFPLPRSSFHKYNRGCVGIVAWGEDKSGASKLAAHAALRAGAGMVKIFCRKDAVNHYVSDIHSIIIETIDSLEEFRTKVIGDARITTLLVGPGTGVNEITKTSVIEILKAKKPVIIDADAITCFKDNPDELFINIHDSCILTPHFGEFKRLFPILNNKIETTMNAANLSKSVLIFKGSDTVISDNKYAFINSNAPAWLATAGSGDVLAGIAAAIYAQKLASHENKPLISAAIATWIHGECAQELGLGMIADDLPTQIPKVYKKLFT